MPRSRRIRALFRGAAVHGLSGLRAAQVSGGSCKLRFERVVAGGEKQEIKTVGA